MRLQVLIGHADLPAAHLRSGAGGRVDACRRRRSPRTPASARVSNCVSRWARGSLVERMLADGSLDPPTRVFLVLHLDGRPTVLSDGVVTRHDVAGSNDAGASTLTLTGVDVSQMMDLIDLSGLPMPMPAEARVLTLLAPFAAYGVRPAGDPERAGVRAEPGAAHPGGTAAPTFAYVSQLADEVGYTFYVEPGPDPGDEPRLLGAGDAGRPAPAGADGERRRRRQRGVAVVLLRRDVRRPSTCSPRSRSRYRSRSRCRCRTSARSTRRWAASSRFRCRTGGSASGVQPQRTDDATARMDVVQTLARGLARAAQSAHVISGSGSLDVARSAGLLQCRRLVGVRGAGAGLRRRSTYVKQRHAPPSRRRGQAALHPRAATRRSRSSGGRVQP